ncbi:MAG TPA: hypothetical protein VF730_17445, partial [Terracidiphilus sp.]
RQGSTVEILISAVNAAVAACGLQTSNTLHGVAKSIPFDFNVAFKSSTFNTPNLCLAAASRSLDSTSAAGRTLCLL